MRAECSRCQSGTDLGILRAGPTSEPIAAANLTLSHQTSTTADVPVRQSALPWIGSSVVGVSRRNRCSSAETLLERDAPCRVASSCPGPARRGRVRLGR